MVQIALCNATTVVNGDIFEIIALKFFLIVSVAEAVDVAGVHVPAEDMTLYCYISALDFLRTLL